MRHLATRAQGFSISVVVCAYTERRWDDLVRAVESLQQQSEPPSEIIIVVDHNPALLQCARTKFPAEVCVANREARGLSGARNTGVAVACGAIVAFLDDDATAAPDWLAVLGSRYRTPDVLGVGGSIVPCWPQGRPAWFPEEFDWVVGCTYRGMPRAASQVRNLIGANMSFRREAFETVGGFRHGMGRIGALPLGCEETDLCIRLHQRHPHGLLIYEPKARVTHRVTSSRTQWRYFCSRCYAEGRSKSQLTRFVGRSKALAAERAYMLHVLPRAAARGLLEATVLGDPAGLGRAWAVVGGLALTATGYVVGDFAGRMGGRGARRTGATN